MKQFVAMAVAVLWVAGFSTPAFSEMDQEKLQMSEMKKNDGKGGMAAEEKKKDECGDKLPCATAVVAAGSNPSCSNGGNRCAAPGAACTKMNNVNGRCTDFVGGGYCTCLCY